MYNFSESVVSLYKSVSDPFHLLKEMFTVYILLVAGRGRAGPLGPSDWDRVIKAQKSVPLSAHPDCHYLFSVQLFLSS